MNRPRVVIIGGGFGGLFRRVDTRTARVILLEGGPRVLPTFPEDLSKKAVQPPA